MAWRHGERTVAGDDRRVECLCQSHVHGVVRRDVFTQLPRASQQIEMGVAVEIEVREIRNRFGGAVGGHLTRTHEAPEALRHFNVHQVGRMQLVLVSKEARLDAGAERCLQEKLQQRRGVNDDHADSRSSRMTTAAGVFSATRLRL